MSCLPRLSGLRDAGNFSNIRGTGDFFQHGLLQSVASGPVGVPYNHLLVRLIWQHTGDLLAVWPTMLHQELQAVKVPPSRFADLQLVLAMDGIAVVTRPACH